MALERSPEEPAKNDNAKRGKDMSMKPSLEEALRQKMNDLPLPDENASWQKMKALLDEKEKRKPFLFFRNEKMAGGALLLFILLLWFILSLQTEKKPINPPVRKDDMADKANTNLNQEKKTTIDEETSGKSKTKQAHSDTSLSSLTTSSAASVSSLKNDHFLSKKKNIVRIKNQTDLVNKKVLSIQPNTKQASKKRTQKNNIPALQNYHDEVAASGARKQKQQSSFIDSSSQLSAAISSSTSASNDIDSNQNTTTIKNNLRKADSVFANNTTSKATVHIKHRDDYFIDAGIGIKQQLPIGNQAFSAYNYNGKKTWIGDYIPSLYIRLEKEKRWFIQGEFHYAAPRLVNGIAYWQKTKADYGHSSTTMDRYQLQKTWYDEVPVSFNLYLRSSWSAGIGAMYNRLRGASVKKETSVYNALSAHTISNDEILPWKGFTDSFLYRTNASLLLQTDYQAARWSFGLRYIQDVQPFLTYTLPGGDKKDKLNASLELLIRYRLYRSDKFRIGKR